MQIPEHNPHNHQPARRRARPGYAGRNHAHARVAQASVHALQGGRPAADGPGREAAQRPAPDGQFLALLMGLTEFWQMLWTRVIGRQRVRGAIVLETKADVEHLMALAAAGHLKPVIDRRFPFEQIVEAHRRVDSGRKVGSVVVTLVP